MSDARRIQPDTPENRILNDRVHPDGWINPTPAGRYNLVVLGAGTAGLVCAAGAAGLGARVALIEPNLMGGDCLNAGCVPSKGLIRAARSVYDARTAGVFGVRGTDALTAGFSEAMERMRRLRADISVNDSARRFRDELGVDVYFGAGHFTGRDSIDVNGQRLPFSRAAICTGARAAAPPIPGLADSGYLTNETVFSLTSLPPRLAVIGSGPIGCELAQSFARFGSQVTVLEQSDHILGREDHDAALIVQKALERDGVVIRLNAGIKSIISAGAERVIRLEAGSEQQEIPVDAILVATGRTPNVERLNLEAAGVAYGPAGITVNDHLQTANPAIYAAGDVCSPYKFTHTADAQARILLANALFMGRQRMSSLVIPWCTYTDPEIAHVGMYEDEARRNGIDVVTLTVPLADVDRAVLDGETEGFGRVLLQKGTDRILGATIVARHAGEMIGELSLAITAGLGLGAIGRTIHPYPTQAEVVKKLADMYNRTRLTPRIKSILKGWLAWRRG